MKSVRRIDPKLTNHILTHVIPTMPFEARQMVSSTQIYVAWCRVGRADFLNRIVRVPAWVFTPTVNFCFKGLVPGGDPFAAYYLAHELAHVKSRTGDHGEAFMSAFRELCPEAVQWYETIYKPRNASLAGISTNNKEITR